MKKTLFLGMMTLTLFTLTTAGAETFVGKVQDIQGNLVSVKTEEGQVKQFKTTDKTSYRQKKMKKHHKVKRGKMPAASVVGYEPMIEEDDWIELSYTPGAQSADTEEIDSVIVYDD